MPVVLPTLEHFQFRGISEYLEDLVSRVSALLLTQLSIVLFKDIIFDIPEPHKFITRAEKVTPLNHAQLLFDDTMSKIVLELPIRFELELIGEEQGYQLLSMMDVCQSHLSFLSRVVQLDICEDSWLIVGKSKKIMKLSLWLEFFRPLNSVRSLSVFETWEPLVGAALQELTGGRTLEVLPELQNLSLDELGPSGSARETMEIFVALRRLSDRPIVAQRRKRNHPNPNHSSTCREWE